LRDTYAARSHFIWDIKSPIFIHNHVLYVPALLMNHFGEALDDKTAFRKAENFIEK
jgi:glutamine synthetase type III